jgi:hypothetical protein
MGVKLFAQGISLWGTAETPAPRRAYGSRRGLIFWGALHGGGACVERAISLQQPRRAHDGQMGAYVGRILNGAKPADRADFAQRS